MDTKKHSNIVENIDWVLSELSVAVHKILNGICCMCISFLQQNTSIFMNFIRTVSYSTI